MFSEQQITKTCWLLWSEELNNFLLQNCKPENFESHLWNYLNNCRQFCIDYQRSSWRKFCSQLFRQESSESVFQFVKHFQRAQCLWAKFCRFRDDIKSFHFIKAHWAEWINFNFNFTPAEVKCDMQKEIQINSTTFEAETVSNWNINWGNFVQKLCVLLTKMSQRKVNSHKTKWWNIFPSATTSREANGKLFLRLI